MHFYKDQITFQPEVSGDIPSHDKVVIGGMGGSALAARALMFLDPVFPAWLHNDYGLPDKIEGEPLFVAISYSGNTDETESFAHEAHGKGLPLVIITSGGSLREFAVEEGIPHVLVPGGLQPREALVYMLKALLQVLSRTDLMEQLERANVDDLEIEKEATAITSFLSEGTPAIYSSQKNSVLSYIWKILLNETAKMSAVCNSFPELTHNEIEVVGGAQRTVLLTDEGDNAGVKGEMEAFLEISAERGWPVMEVSLGAGKAENLIRCWLLAQAVARSLAGLRGVDPDSVMIIENFKKRL